LQVKPRVGDVSDWESEASDAEQADSADDTLPLTTLRSGRTIRTRSMIEKERDPTDSTGESSTQRTPGETEGSGKAAGDAEGDTRAKGAEGVTIRHSRVRDDPAPIKPGNNTQDPLSAAQNPLQKLTEDLQKENELLRNNLRVVNENNANNNNPRGRPAKVEAEPTKEVDSWIKEAERNLVSKLEGVEKKLTETLVKLPKARPAKGWNEDSDSDEAGETSEIETPKLKRKTKGQDFRLPDLKVPTYQRGLMSWEDFVEKFTLACECSAWERRDYGLHLNQYLEGEALNGYKEVKQKHGDKILRNLSKLLKEIGKYIRRDTAVYRNKLKSFKLTMHMDLYEACEKMLELAKQAYPEADYETRKEFVKEYFLSALPKQIRHRITVAIYGNELDVTTIAGIAESVRCELLEEEAGKGVASQVDVNQIGQQTHGPKQDKNHKRDLSHVPCYHCGELGHMQHSCKRKAAGEPKTYNGPIKPPRGSKNNGYDQQSGQLKGMISQMNESIRELRDAVQHNLQGNAGQ